MKYLYFDCFAGFTPAMAAGALADMIGSRDELEKMAQHFDAELIEYGEVRRCSMEAMYLQVKTISDGSAVKKDDLLKLVENSGLSSIIREKLKSVISIKAIARAMNPEDAQFDVSVEVPELVCMAYVFEKLDMLKVAAVYVSSVLYSDGAELLGTHLSPVTPPETLYICKKYGIKINPSPINSELISEGGAALLGVLDSQNCVALPGSIIKIGYGAGAEDFADTPNLVRVVFGEDDGADSLFESESAFEDVFAEFAAEL